MPTLNDGSYTLHTVDPDGLPVTTYNHTEAGAERLMAEVLIPRGYGPAYELTYEDDTPLPAEALSLQSRRLAGCQSAHTGECYGDLWQCAECGKVTCCAEGTTDHPELCDDCWTRRFGR